MRKNTIKSILFSQYALFVFYCIIDGCKNMELRNGNLAHNIKVYTMSMESIIDDCKRWAKEIDKTYQPDLIVFIAKSGFLFAKPISEYFDCKMVDIIASRPGSSIKNRLKKVIKCIPDRMILKILSSPYMYKFNERKCERNIEITSRYDRERHKTHEKILVIDDSVDTGWTMQRVLREVKASFKGAEIKIASYSIIAYSKCRINIDYYRYEDAVIMTATSRKSKQYTDFLRDYDVWIAGYEKSN